jgi:hypothetical protein
VVDLRRPKVNEGAGGGEGGNKGRM